MNRGISRRTVLIAALAAGSGVGLFVTLRGGRQEFSGEGAESLKEILRLISDHRSARLVGRAVALASPEPLDEKHLRSDLFSVPAREKPADAVQALLTQIERDFLQGRVTLVDGWVLAETEAKVYALISLIPS